MEELLVIFNVTASIIIIPLTNYLKMKLPNLSFIPPIIALVLASISAFGFNKLLGANLDIKTLLMIIFGVQFLSQIGYEGKKLFVGGK